jgi:tRNA(Leu) C34 or U34 (ribose-2'-O)-methylase TrmL
LTYALALVLVSTSYGSLVSVFNLRPCLDVVPVAIELVPGSENLIEFEHPEKAVYVFGPEDGSVSQVVRRYCHRFIKIPARHCTNLSAVILTLIKQLQ